VAAVAALGIGGDTKGGRPVANEQRKSRTTASPWVWGESSPCGAAGREAQSPSPRRRRGRRGSGRTREALGGMQKPKPYMAI